MELNTMQQKPLHQHLICCSKRSLHPQTHTPAPSAAPAPPAAPEPTPPKQKRQRRRLQKKRPPPPPATTPAPAEPAQTPPKQKRQRRRLQKKRRLPPPTSASTPQDSAILAFERGTADVKNAWAASNVSLAADASPTVDDGVVAYPDYAVRLHDVQQALLRPGAREPKSQPLQRFRQYARFADESDADEAAMRRTMAAREVEGRVVLRGEMVFGEGRKVGRGRWEVCRHVGIGGRMGVERERFGCERNEEGRGRGRGGREEMLMRVLPELLVAARVHGVVGEVVVGRGCCRFCYTDYEVAFSRDGPSADVAGLRVTFWRDLGAGLSPKDEKWRRAVGDCSTPLEGGEGYGLKEAYVSADDVYFVAEQTEWMRQGLFGKCELFKRLFVRPGLKGVAKRREALKKAKAEKKLRPKAPAAQVQDTFIESCVEYSVLK